MSGDPYPSFPHNAWWRKLRRRYFVNPYMLIGGVFGCPPAMCSLSWLLRGPQWLTVCCGALWFFSSLFMTQVYASAFMVTTMNPQKIGRPISGKQKLAMLWSLIVHFGTCIVLIMGRVDLAFYLVFGLNAWSELLGQGRELSFRTFVRLMLSLALCLAFATDASRVVVGLLLINVLPIINVLPWERSQPRLAEWIRSLPTRAGFVARNREACAAGGG